MFKCSWKVSNTALEERKRKGRIQLCWMIGDATQQKYQKYLKLFKVCTIIAFINYAQYLVKTYVTGKTYAMNIMKVVTVHILRKYRLTTQVRLEDIEYELKIVMFSKTPLPLDLEPRTNVAS